MDLLKTFLRAFFSKTATITVVHNHLKSLILCTTVRSTDTGICFYHFWRENSNILESWNINIRNTFLARKFKMRQFLFIFKHSEKCQASKRKVLFDTNVSLKKKKKKHSKNFLLSIQVYSFFVSLGQVSQKIITWILYLFSNIALLKELDKLLRWTISPCRIFRHLKKKRVCNKESNIKKVFNQPRLSIKLSKTITKVEGGK